VEEARSRIIIPSRGADQCARVGRLSQCISKPCGYLKVHCKTVKSGCRDGSTTPLAPLSLSGLPCFQPAPNSSRKSRSRCKFVPTCKRLSGLLQTLRQLPGSSRLSRTALGRPGIRSRATRGIFSAARDSCAGPATGTAIRCPAHSPRLGSNTFKRNNISHTKWISASLFPRSNPFALCSTRWDLSVDNLR